jgi:ADP-ribose pyrophosphatase YjhB (NUDIX family)
VPEPGSPEFPERLAGRVIVVDPARRVLLFYYDDPPPKGRHWATPGGGVEDGEDVYPRGLADLVRRHFPLPASS